MTEEDVIRILGEPLQIVHHDKWSISLHYPTWTVVLHGVLGDGLSIRHLDLPTLERVAKALRGSG